MTAYYNEIDPYAAQWLRNLMAAGHIAKGEVDERSITEIQPDDLRGFDQCHFFAGIGVWSHALRRAGWPDDRPVWTGSCPCQPFSAAGKQKGFDDERHLWPVWFRLIDQRRPSVILGEQVASALDWLDLVSADMEASGYAFGASDLCAAGFGGAHIRQRLYFFGMANGEQPRLERYAGDGDDWNQPRRDDADQAGSVTQSLLTSLVGAGWQRVMFAAECDQDGDGWCAIRDIDPAECDCIGPTEDDVEYQEFHGELWGRRIGAGKRSGALCRPNAPLFGRDAADWLYCRDGKWRPVEPGTFPLADEAPSRVGRLRAYGNGLDAETATQFCKAVIECLP